MRSLKNLRIDSDGQTYLVHGSATRRVRRDTKVLEVDCPILGQVSSRLKDYGRVRIAAIDQLGLNGPWVFLSSDVG